MVGDRRTAALISTDLSSIVPTRDPRTARCVLLVSLIAICALPLGSCVNRRTIFESRKKSTVAAPPAVGAMSANAHGQLASFDVVEVAIQRPGGAAALSVRTAFREALYEQLLAKGYSPLSLDYVDAAGASVDRPGQTFPLRSSITGVRRASDGGVIVSGWIGLVATQDDGSETTLYLGEVTDLAVPPVTGPSRADGGPNTGVKLADALLAKFPAR